MDIRIKNFLGGAIALAVLGVSISGLWFVKVFSDASAFSSIARSFTVTGEGKAVAVPDIAETTFSTVTEGGKDLTALQKENTDKTNRAIDFLKSKGIDAKDIKTSQYSVEPRYQYFSCYPASGNAKPCPPSEIVGYTISQSVEVKIRKFDVIGDVLTGVVSNGANRVSGVNFTLDDPTKPQNEAREEAIAKARAKAQAVAAAGGFHLGRLLSIEEGGGYYPSPVYGLGATAVSKETTASPTIEPGSQDVKMTLTLRYEID